MKITITSDTVSRTDDDEAFYLCLPDDEEGDMFDIEIKEEFIEELASKYIPIVRELDKGRYVELTISTNMGEIEPYFTRDLHGTNLYCGAVCDTITAEALNGRWFGKRIYVDKHDLTIEIYDSKCDYAGIQYVVTDTMKQHPSIQKAYDVQQ